MRWLLYSCFLCASTGFRGTKTIPPISLPHSSSSSSYISHCRKSRVGLYPLQIEEMFQNDSPRYDSTKYGFALIEEKDLHIAAQLSMLSFYNPRVRLNTSDMLGIEKVVWSGIIGTFNSLDKIDAKNSHYIGFKSRAFRRLSNPGLYISCDSMLLAMTELSSNQLIGLVEICLEEANGKLAPAVAMPLPWRKVKESFQPYLCNLCVDTSRRRQGFGSILCQVAERIVVKYWKKEKMYLHVEENNLAARRLYEGLSYSLGPQLPFYERKLHGLESILYYVKDLRPASASSHMTSSSSYLLNSAASSSLESAERWNDLN